MSHDERAFERIAVEPIHSGRIITFADETYRYADGKTAMREIVRTTGAAGIVPVDDEHVWLVRQPREAIDNPDSLEIPAGRLDVEGEAPLQTAQRELAEEIGLQAARWTPLKAYHSSVGFADEQVHLFLAEELSAAEGEHDSGEDERIEIVRWPLADLDGALDATTDAKTLIALLLLREIRRARSGP
jgi:8-oxo-dGTP pyrophosphatase MutT (NUDIX family)